MTFNHKEFGVYEKYIKRPLDCVLAIGFVLVFSWLYIILAILVKLKLGSPILFKQMRPGRNEQIFGIYKFRTMIDAYDEKGEPLPDEVRLTSFGKWLRSTSLDELPEIFNIINGDMAVIGPRPLLVKYLPYYTNEQHRRHEVRPGLTGYAQAHGRNGVDWDDKFAMDVNYVDHITFMGDVQILIDTVLCVVKKEGITSATSATMEDFRDYVRMKRPEQVKHLE